MEIGRKEAVSCIYDYARSFSDGVAKVDRYSDKNEIHEFIDKEGNVILTFQLSDEVNSKNYYRVFDFKEGIAFVCKNGKYLFTDKTGNRCEMKGGLINKNGQEIIPCLLDGFSGFSKGLAPVKLNGKWGILYNPTKAPPFATRLDWKAPDPDNHYKESKPFLTKEPMTIQLRIEAERRLTYENIEVYLNGRGHELGKSGNLLDYKGEKIWQLGA